MDLARIEAYLNAHRSDSLEQLKELIRIKSISAQPDHNPDTRRAAVWVRDNLTSMGLASELIETKGHPIVYAEWLAAPGKPTVLVYGHYDVQPPEPLEPWLSPPFEPTERDGNLYARGATDDKGQMFTHLKAAEAWLKTFGKLPINVKFVIEGEEEVGGANLEVYMAEQAARLACDYAVISDSSQFAPGAPAITYGLKGLAYFEILVQGANRDLHSGTYGGAVTNPLNALATILASLKGADGRIQLAGFYDSVKPLADWERKQFAALAFSEKDFQADLAVTSLEGEAGFTTLERKWARPTCDVNGLYGGYAGPGPKTVLPCKAGAKLSFRLVPDQHPKTVERQFRDHVARVCPKGVTYEIITHHGAPAVLVNTDTPGVKAAVRAIETGFGTKPVFIREGGSIPVVGLIKQQLGVDTLLLGWGQNDDNLHGPNEKFSIADFHRGIKASACLLAELGELGSNMLDVKYVVANPEAVKENCRNRNVPSDVLEDVDRAVALEGERRELLQGVEEIRRRQNEIAQATGKERDPEKRSSLIDVGKALKTQVAEEEEKLRRLEGELHLRLRRIPNLTHPDAPVGRSEEDSREIRKSGTPRVFDFKPKDHVELGKELDLIDFETAGKVSGSGFYFLKNDAVLLDLGLQQLALNKLIKAGFTPIVTPDLVRNNILEGIGFTPRGEETQVYSIEDSDLSLIGTAEITLGGMHADDVLAEPDLPLKYVGLSHCFRTEAGAAGRASRGLYRVHQFTKVEMFAFCTPESSGEIHAQMLEIEEAFFESLGIPFRVLDIASGDLGGPAYRKFDVEAWMPGRGEHGEFGEVTSTSDCTDYQARRLNIRYRPSGQKGTRFVHTLNGTAVALSRALIVILENYQRADGLIDVPEVLRPYVGKDVIGRR